jgi:hypothetical protein
MCLTWANEHHQGQAPAITELMDLAGQPAPRASDPMISRLGEQIRVTVCGELTARGDDPTQRRAGLAQCVVLHRRRTIDH